MTFRLQQFFKKLEAWFRKLVLEGWRSNLNLKKLKFVFKNTKLALFGKKSNVAIILVVFATIMQIKQWTFFVNERVIKQSCCCLQDSCVLVKRYRQKINILEGSHDINQWNFPAIADSVILWRNHLIVYEWSVTSSPVSKILKKKRY